ncbi:MAG: DMT family transporter [Ignavibacteria bacterium]|nr:DMT family transporter [Ignavibacteria bacterium]
MHEKVSHYKAELILLFVTVSWGLSFPTIKIGLNYISPVFFVFIRFTLTLIIFYLLFRKKLSLLKKENIIKGIILGIFLYTGFLTQTIGLKYTTASNSAFITGTNILIIPFAQILIIRKYPKIENIIGIFVAFAGMYFLTGIGDMKINIGDIFTFLCAVSFAFQIVMLDFFSRTTDYLSLIYGQFIAMSVFSFATTLVVEIAVTNEFLFIPSFNLLFVILFNTVFSTLIALFLSSKYQRYTTPVKAGLIYNSEVVFAVIFAYMILNEVLSGKQIAGAILILAGVIISEFSREIFNRKK